MLTGLLGFALATTLLIVAPGPDTMVVIRNTLRGGRRPGVTTSAGILTGLFIWAVAAALGLSALLQASRVGYDVLRFAGAVYLTWLGLTSLGLFRRRGTRHQDGVEDPAEAQRPAVTPRRAYLNGVMSNLFNPKIGVFFIAFLPGFIPAGQSAMVSSFLLGMWFVAETGLWLAALVWMATRGVGWLRHSAAQRWLERATGVVLIGFGVRLATEAR
jgi:threonine/homoserine/homoserine lactone efflux protein